MWALSYPIQCGRRVWDRQRSASETGAHLAPPILWINLWLTCSQLTLKNSGKTLEAVLHARRDHHAQSPKAGGKIKHPTLPRLAPLASHSVFS
jgi:hypothetical protein